MKRLLLASVALVAFCSAALAANKPITPYSGYPYGGAGFYYGIYTEAGGGSVTTPGAAPDLTTTSMGVGGLVGYAWGGPNSPAFYAVEAMFGWNNINGSAAGFSFSGPAAFEQRFIFGSPIASLLSIFPTLNLPTVAPFPQFPNGATVSNVQAYLMAGLHEDDISFDFTGVSSGHEWRVAPSVGIGMRGQLTNGVAVDAWVETIFPEQAHCIGGVPGACSGMGQQIKAGLALLY